MSERAISVAGTRDAGQWTVTIQVRIVGGAVIVDRPLRFTAKASTLAYAIASATLQATSAGVQIDG